MSRPDRGLLRLLAADPYPGPPASDDVLAVFRAALAGRPLAAPEDRVPVRSGLRGPRAWTAVLVVVLLVFVVPVGTLVIGTAVTSERRGEQQQAFVASSIPFATECVRPAENPVCVQDAEASVNHALAASADDTQLRAVLRSHPQAPVAPLGRGPWPFVVVDTDQAGLYARSTADADGRRLGVAVNHAVVWVECLTVSDYVPPGVDGADSTWARVHWEPQDDERAAIASDPAEERTAWMYRAYLEPLQHNGSVPRCAAPGS